MGGSVSEPQREGVSLTVELPLPLRERVGNLLSHRRPGLEERFQGGAIDDLTCHISRAAGTPSVGLTRIPRRAGPRRGSSPTQQRAEARVARWLQSLVASPALAGSPGPRRGSFQSGVVVRSSRRHHVAIAASHSPLPRHWDCLESRPVRSDVRVGDRLIARSSWRYSTGCSPLSRWQHDGVRGSCAVLQLCPPEGLISTTISRLSCWAKPRRPATLMKLS